MSLSREILVSIELHYLFDFFYMSVVRFFHVDPTTQYSLSVSLQVFYVIRIDVLDVMFFSVK